MTPEQVAQVGAWLGVLEKGGMLLVLALLVLSFWRGDLLSRKAVNEMIPQIVEQCVTQTVQKIKADIAQEVRWQVNEIGRQIVEHVSDEIDKKKNAW